jgi:hypothetical protein
MRMKEKDVEDRDIRCKEAEGLGPRADDGFPRVGSEMPIPAYDLGGIAGTQPARPRETKWLRSSHRTLAPHPNSRSPNPLIA